MRKNNECYQLLIGKLELMLAAAQPGCVLTEEMSLICAETIEETVNTLKEIDQLRKITCLELESQKLEL